MRVLVTGSSGLVGSAAVEFYDRRGCEVHGLDNNMRRSFFGPEADTSWNLRRLREVTRSFRHRAVDVRDRRAVLDVFADGPFDLVIHCAAQPSHDLAARRPFDDFDVNAVGTMNLLEATRLRSPDAVFILMSTNKVYGDAPNELELTELATRYDYARPEDYDGIAEEMRIDRSLHSLFGASKVAADVMTQEYGRYYGMHTGVFRAGCMTGPQHSAVELHGFLSYLVKTAMSGGKYTIFGYQGKQVRDQIHCDDVVSAIDAFYRHPRCGEVYNLGGGRDNSASVLECINMIADQTGRAVDYDLDDRPRRGDHICYITNLSKLRRDFPEWKLTRTIPDMIDEMPAPAPV